MSGDETLDHLLEDGGSGSADDGLLLVSDDLLAILDVTGADGADPHISAPPFCLPSGDGWNIAVHSIAFFYKPVINRVYYGACTEDIKYS